MTVENDSQQYESSRGITISFKFLAVTAIVVVLILGLVAVWYFAIRSTPSAKPKTASPAVTKTIHLTYPSDWKVVSSSSLSGVPPHAIFALQQQAKLGLLIVLSSGKAPAVDIASGTNLSAALAKQYSDYEFLGTNIVPLKTGKALAVSYIRKKQGMLHTVMIIPAGQQSFIIETVSTPSDSYLGTEIGMILDSATITSKS